MIPLLMVACLIGPGSLAQNAVKTKARPPGQAGAEVHSLRVATFNIEDVRSEDLRNGENIRLRQVAAILQEIQADILVLNEIAFDVGEEDNARQGNRENEQEQNVGAGQNAARFVRHYLSVAQRDGLQPLEYQTFMGPSNTGLASGFDLNRDGVVVHQAPAKTQPENDGEAPPITDVSRAYGADCWGFGAFPGQFAMAVLIRKPLQIDTNGIRTFQHFRWRDMPQANLPSDENGVPWYGHASLEEFPLSSKSHWDVPVLLPSGTSIHLLVCHPTPPAFDGPEKRNQNRNHDEIRFWLDYVAGESYFVDDQGRQGGLPEGTPAIVIGDLNADPTDGGATKIATQLLQHEKFAGAKVPQSDSGDWPKLRPQATAQWGLQVDYVLPSIEFETKQTGIWRTAKADSPSDHFPVWADLVLRRPEALRQD